MVMRSVWLKPREMPPPVEMPPMSISSGMEV